MSNGKVTVNFSIPVTEVRIIRETDNIEHLSDLGGTMVAAMEGHKKSLEIGINLYRTDSMSEEQIVEKAKQHLYENMFDMVNNFNQSTIEELLSVIDEDIQ